MFNTKKFGGYLSRLRKKADMTQSELADMLNLSRQAVSRYETGESFPDVSILVLIADILNVTLDDLINSGEPSRGESLILGKVAIGNKEVLAENISDIVGLAPLLKPSVLTNLFSGLIKHGIDISNIVTLAEYLSEDSVMVMLENATFESISPDLLEKLLPLLDNKSKNTIFQKVLDGEIDFHMLRTLIPYMEYIGSQIEAAVVEGLLPWEALDIMREGNRDLYEKQQKNGDL